MAPTRTDPLLAAARVTGAARDFAAELADGFRKSDRAFKLRAGVVAGWAALSLLSLWIAWPSSGPGNSLGAVARLESAGIMGAQVLVQNDGQELWTDVTLTLDDGWRLQVTTVRPGDRPVFPVTRFEKEGVRWPADRRPARLTIECAEGRAATSLGASR